jgi:hypothetical protein
MSYGFIITRHVRSETTNKYWNHCIGCIRKLYSHLHHKIVVIDDNSDPTFLKAEDDFTNVEYVQSEFIGRGELLPYYYFFKNHYFDSAVILHDSVFFHKKINFSKLSLGVLPLWHFSEIKTENLDNVLRLSQHLTNNWDVQRTITKSKYEVLSMSGNFGGDVFGCFGVQSYIKYEFLAALQAKYGIFNLLGVVKTRKDRCCLERIFGIIFNLECTSLKQYKSLMGNIFTYCKWGYAWEDYVNDVRLRKKTKPVVKVWTGR